MSDVFSCKASCCQEPLRSVLCGKHLSQGGFFFSLIFSLILVLTSVWPTHHLGLPYHILRTATNPDGKGYHVRPLRHVKPSKCISCCSLYHRVAYTQMKVHTCLRLVQGRQGHHEHWNIELGCSDLKQSHRWSDDTGCVILKPTLS